MGQRPRPHANGVNLALIAERAKFDQLIARYQAVAPDARAAGIPVDLMLLTARFEHLTAVVAQFTGQDTDLLMQRVEGASVERALAQVAAAVTALNMTDPPADPPAGGGS